MNEKGQVKNKGKVVLLENGDRPSVDVGVFRRWRHTGTHHLKHSPKRWMRLVDKPAGIVFIYKTFGGTGYGALDTKYLHRWNIKRVLRRVGWR